MHLFRFPGGVAGFSEKADGNLNFYDQAPGPMAKIWKALPWVGAHGLDTPRFATQIHGDKVLLVGEVEHKEGNQGDGDALLTAAKGIPIGVFTADCLPVLFAADGVVMAVHAGWKGTRQCITGRAIEFLNGAFPGALARVQVFMGPCIGACCLELGDEVVEEFRATQPGSKACFSRGKKWHLDLRALNVIHCLERGIPLSSIRHVNDCTKCLPDRYFSYRYQGGRGGSMFAFVSRLPDSEQQKTWGFL